MAEMRVSSKLPEYVVFNLLSWLPVKSLLRFKSVCKLWLSIISKPEFIEAHLTNSKKKQAYVPSTALVVEKFGFLEKRKLYIVESIKDMIVSLHLPPQLSPRIRFVNSYNGLVCLANSNCDVIYLWNPLTNWYKILPTPNKKTGGSANTTAFGFDSTSNDYKILRILIATIEVDNITYTCRKLTAEMYSANADSWKEIELPTTLQSFTPYRCQSMNTMNGVLYLQHIDAIVSFNWHNEVFEVYPFTNPLSRINRWSDMLEFEGSVAMVFSEGSILSNDSVLSLWTLDDVCGKVSWTKKFDLELSTMRYRVCYYLGVGQFVVKNYSRGYFIYDCKTKAIQNLAWVIEDASVFKYTESLVSLKGFKQQE